MTRRRLRVVSLVTLLCLAAALPALAQRGRRFGFGWGPSASAPIAYDGRFVIVRLWYASYPGWSYDYPDMEHNLSLIFKDLTALRVHPNGSNIFRMDDPELLKFPIAYLSEPGYWYP